MGQYYQLLDRPYFDYDLFTIEGINNTSFRGPAFDQSKPYVACMGAAQTFGRFVDRPYPAILAERFGSQFVNLGVGAAGPLWFDAPQYIDLANQAKFVIVQVLSGRSESNSLFDNSSTGGLMGVRKADKRLMRFEEFLTELMETESRDRVKEIILETRASYLHNMMNLLQHIYRPKIFFWFSRRSPDYKEGFGTPWELLGEYPQLVNQAMVDMLRPYIDHYVECISSRGFPQKLWQSDNRIDGTELEDGWLVNQYYPTPEMHQEAAELLAPACTRWGSALK
jgi:hypothetical protein